MNILPKWISLSDLADKFAYFTKDAATFFD
jgi:hypothetical protein